MCIWKIRGGERLFGRVRVQGAKNGVLPIMAASILAPCETELTNCPDLRDVRSCIRILEHLGCAVERDGDTICIDSRPLCRCAVPPELMREMRSSVIFLGAMLARCGCAELTRPGGCELGPRPIDLHLEALRALGAEIEEDGCSVRCRAAGGLRGCAIRLRCPSVGATENAMLAACAAEGETTIENAAREPEIVDLQSYLRALGADIEGAGSGRIQIRGFCPVERVGHRILPDRIAAATLLCSGAAAGGDIALCGAEPGHLLPVTEALRAMGCEIRAEKSVVRLISDGRLRAAPPVETAPYPGFPTDAQPLLLAASLRAKGTAVFTENVFSDRFRYTEELRKLGARIRTDGRTALVTGVEKLTGCPVKATDLRGGAALILAGLCAEGETLVSDDGHVERGYEDLDGQLRQLGASVEKRRELC